MPSASPTATACCGPITAPTPRSASQTGSQTTSGGVLDLNLGGLITTDKATIDVGAGAASDGGIYSFDRATQTYQSLQSTLTDVASGGRLIIENSFSTTAPLTIDGELTLFGSGVYTGPLHVTEGATVDGDGTLSGSIENDGLIVAQVPSPQQPVNQTDTGWLILDGPVTGTGTIEVGPGLVSYQIGIRPPTPVVQRAGIEIVSQLAENVSFADSNGELILDDVASFGGTITAQAPGLFEDLVVLDNVSLNDVTTYDYVGDDKSGVLTIDEGSVRQTLRFVGDYTTASFQLSAGPQVLSNSPPSLDISIACYARGTAIRTGRGNVAVEALGIGDRVVTFDGAHRPIKWIGRRSYGGRFLASSPAVQPILFRAGSLGRYQPRRDLRVSPKHAMFLDGVLVPAECLINGTSIVRDVDCAEIEYFHVELDSHDVLLAEDAPSESFVDDDSRAMFNNAAEYRALYGNSPAAFTGYCAPRIEDGETLERIRRRIDDNGRTTSQPEGGALRGHIDAFDGIAVRGWAQDANAPDVPVCLEVWSGGMILGRTVANQFRADLRGAGMGSGCHGFRIELEEGCSAPIEVRRVMDGAVLGLRTARQDAA